MDLRARRIRDAKGCCRGRLCAAVDRCRDDSFRSIGPALAGKVEIWALLWRRCLAPPRLGGNRDCAPLIEAPAIAALWLVTRTGGIPIGPDTGESATLIDAIATAYEVALDIGVFVAAAVRPERLAFRRWLERRGHLGGGSSRGRPDYNRPMVATAASTPA